METTALMEKGGAAPTEEAKGLLRHRMLPNAHPELAFYRCTLKAGCRWEPPLYPLSQKMQMFYFLTPTGYAATKRRAWNIDEEALFIPNYDKEPFWLEAGEEDMEFVHLVGVMNDYDEKEYIDYHLVLPFFRTLSRGLPVQENNASNAGSSIRTRRMVLDTAFGRWFMGVSDGEGESAFVAEHSLPDYQQWSFALPGSHFSCTVNGKEHQMQEGDLLFIPKGSRQSARAAAGQRIAYLWVKFASEGFPVGKDGYPGSET